MASRMDNNIVNSKNRCFLFVFFYLPAQNRPHPRHQNPRAERLGDVIVSAKLQACHNIRLLALGRQHHDGDILGPGIILENLCDFQAVYSGKHEVLHQEIRYFRLGQSQGLFSRCCAGYIVALSQEIKPEQL
ncbi:hypothetical protein ES703_97096 [subsurface metagenome]